MPEQARAASHHKPAEEPRIQPDRPPDPKAKAVATEPNPLKRLLAVLGPGLITGASDDDPSGIGTYAQAGNDAHSGSIFVVVVGNRASAGVTALAS